MHLAVLLAILALPTAALPAKTKVAVTEVKSVQGVAPGTATILSDIVVSEVARAGFDVISQADISSMIGFEKQKKMLGCEETTCLAEIGGALGVDYLITGQVGQIGSRYRISLLVVDSRKSRVTGRAANFSDQNEDALARAAESTVAQLIGSMRASASNQLAPPASASVPAASSPAPPRDLSAGPPPSPPTATATASTGSRHMTTATWVWLGSGTALIVGGTLAVASANKQYDALEAKQGSQGYYDAYNADKDSIQGLAALGTAAIGVGVVAAGVGGWLYWRSDRVSVALIPTVTPGSTGLLAVGRF